MPSNPTDKLGISTPNLAHALARRVWRNRDYEPAFMWWELVVLWRQLFLVGFALLIMAGTVEQLACSFLVALVYMLILSVASPFKEDGDDYFGQACSFSLTAVYFFMFVIKIDLLTNSVDYVLSDQLRDTYKLDIFIVTTGMIGSILLALFLVVVIAAQQILQAARVPTIRFARTKATLDLPLAMGQLWHLFLSHIWGTGQDQCATIKCQLKILVPSASVFLDVDDLQSTDALEEYISKTAMIMIFVSKGYFFSRSKRPNARALTVRRFADALDVCHADCLREVQATVDQKKPLCLMIDPVRGGAPLPDLEAECPAHLQQAIFGLPMAKRSIIAWHRVKDVRTSTLSTRLAS